MYKCYILFNFLPLFSGGKSPVTNQKSHNARAVAPWFPQLPRPCRSPDGCQPWINKPLGLGCLGGYHSSIRL